MSTKVRLDIGCGDKKPEGYVGCDISYYEYPNDDFVQTDINEPLPFDDDTFDECRAMHVMEHIRNDRKVSFMNEVYRILKTGGKFKFQLPPAIDFRGGPNPQFFTDPTHTAWWMPGTFNCFSKSYREFENKEVYENGYGITTNFEIMIENWVDDLSWYCELKKVGND